MRWQFPAVGRGALSLAPAGGAVPVVAPAPRSAAVSRCAAGPWGDQAKEYNTWYQPFDEATIIDRPYSIAILAIAERPLSVALLNGWPILANR